MTNFSLGNIVIMVIAIVTPASPCPASIASFLDITSLSPGDIGGPFRGSFTGTLAGVTVTGSLAAGLDPTTNIVLTPQGGGFFDSVIDGTSPQYRYTNIYAPARNNVDQVGYAYYEAGPTTSIRTLTINFSAPVFNPVFHVANLDSMTYDFSPTTSASSLSLLSGNGGGGDGLSLIGTVLQDADPTTLIGVDTSTMPPTSGPRSGYGSLLIRGSYRSLVINLGVNRGAWGGDGGSFTLSAAAVPEPSAVVIWGLLGLLGVGLARRRLLAR